MESFFSEISEDVSLEVNKNEMRTAVYTTNHLGGLSTIKSFNDDLSGSFDKPKNVKRFHNKLAKLPKIQQKMILKMIEHDLSDEELTELFYVSEKELPHFKEFVSKQLRML